MGYDTLALNEKGESVNGIYVSPYGIEVEFYKNWIYIRDEKGHDEDVSFSNNVVMEFHEGLITYKDTNIVSVRGPQNSICAVIWSGYGKDVTGMIGVSCYGYDKDKWVGVNEDTINHLKNEFLLKTVRKRFAVCSSAKTFIKEMNEHDRKYLFLEAKAINGNTFNYGQFKYDLPEEFRYIDFNDGLRFNQGDKFFSDKYGIDLNCTLVGESNKPVIEGLIEGLIKGMK